MATTVSASLKLFDQFTTTLTRAEQGMQSVINVAERLKRELQNPISLDINMAGALAHIEQVRARIATMGGSSAINVVINEADISAKIAHIQNQIRTGLSSSVVDLTVRLDATAARAQLTALMHSLTGSTGLHIPIHLPNAATLRAQFMALMSSLGTTGIIIHVRLDTARVITQAANLRQRIISMIGTITVRLNIELPAALHTLLSQLINLVRTLTEEVRRLQNGGGPGGGGGGGPGPSGKGGLLGGMGGMATAAAGFLGYIGAKQAIDAADQYVSTQARLELVNDGSRTTRELQDAVFAAAERSRGDYATMASSIGKLGLLAGDSFSGNNELIAFTELMQKSFKVSGASTQESQAGMYQLTQAMAAGKLQGDEFRSIMENAPMLADAIAKFTGKTKGDLKDMSADGVITANIVKGALFSAADDINKKFQSMPKTFGDMFTDVKNKATQSFGPVFEKVSALLNSPGGAAFFANISAGFNASAQAMNYLIDQAVWFGGVVQQNWPLVRAILLSIAAVIMGVMVVSLYEMAAAALAAAWPILLIGAALAGIIYLVQYFGATTEQIIGVVIGYFYMLYSGVYNQIAILWNAFATFAEFLINIFIDPVYAMDKIFYDMASDYLNYLDAMTLATEDFTLAFQKFDIALSNEMVSSWNWLANKMNATLDIYDQLTAKLGLVAVPRFQTAKLFDEKNIETANEAVKRMLGDLNKPKTDKNVLTIPHLGFKDPKGMFEQGYKTGSGLANSVGKMNLNAPSDWGFKPDIPNIGKVGEVGKIKDKVDISSEDLKVMRELADIQNIQNFVTLTPTVQLTTGDINTPTDVNEIIRQIEEVMVKEISNTAQRSYSE